MQKKIHIARIDDGKVEKPSTLSNIERINTNDLNALKAVAVDEGIACKRAQMHLQ